MTETLNYDKKYWEKPCPQVDCRKDSCKCGLKRVFLPASLGDDGKDSPVAPKNGAYCDALVIYEANDHVYIYSKEGIPTLMTSGDSGVEEEINKLKRGLNNEVANRIEGDTTLQNEIDDIKNSPDVVDIVATYADLQSYDTSKLGDNDVIRVLQDEGHDGQSTYYRWNKQSETWTYIGAVGDYYTKGQVDTLLSGKQNQLTAGSNVSIAQEGDDLVISATDTTYSNFVGTDGVTAGSNGLVPAPATTDAGKFLKADGTWDTAGGGNTGEAKALTTDDYNANSSNWSDTDPTHFNCVALWKLPPGMYHRSASTVTVKISRTENLGNGELAIVGKSGTYGIEEFVLTDGVANNGFSYAKVRIVSPLGVEVIAYGLFQTIDDLTKSYTQAPLSANQGKILKNLIDGLVISGAGAPTTSTVGTVGKLYEDTTNGKLYQCTAIDNTDPDNPSYTWGEVGAGGSGPTVVQAIGTSQTAVMSQKAVTDMVFSSQNSTQVSIGQNSDASSLLSIAIGGGTTAALAAKASSVQSIAIGTGARANHRGSISFGKATSAQGEMNVQTYGTGNGYNSTDYRIISGVYDGQSAHDAVTLGQLRSRIIGSLTSAPTTSTAGAVGALVATVESGTGHLYICTDDTGGTYTWQQLV